MIDEDLFPRQQGHPIIKTVNQLNQCNIKKKTEIKQIYDYLNRCTPKRERALYKIQCSFLRKDLNNPGIEGKFHVRIKGISERPTTNTKIDDERLHAVSIR